MAEVAVKSYIFRFIKLNFENSVNCGILKNEFLRTKKEQFKYTMYTTAEQVLLIINTIDNSNNEFI